MPLYEYECPHCQHRFEEIESFSAPEKRKCPKCGKTAERVLTAPAIQFKGSGWYVTDYGRKNGGSKEGTSEAEKPAGAEKAATGKAESGKPGAGKAAAEKKEKAAKKD